MYLIVDSMTSMQEHSANSVFIQQKGKQATQEANRNQLPERTCANEELHDEMPLSNGSPVLSSGQ